MTVDCWSRKSHPSSIRVYVSVVISIDIGAARLYCLIVPNTSSYCQCAADCHRDWNETWDLFTHCFISRFKWNRYKEIFDDNWAVAADGWKWSQHFAFRNKNNGKRLWRAKKNSKLIRIFRYRLYDDDRSITELKLSSVKTALSSRRRCLQTIV